MLTPHDNPKDIIARVQRVARFAHSGSDIGIPWDLFESYIEALERMNAVTLGEESISKRSLSAPVIQPAEGVLTSGVTFQPIAYVYPVIA